MKTLLATLPAPLLGLTLPVTWFIPAILLALLAAAAWWALAPRIQEARQRRQIARWFARRARTLRTIRL